LNYLPQRLFQSFRPRPKAPTHPRAKGDFRNAGEMESINN
jgi:hypothetical protein